MRLMLTHACTARAPATLLLAFGVLAACDDPRRSGPVALPGAAQTIAYEDSVRNGLIRAHATTPATTNPAEALIAADPGVSIVSLTPSNHQGYDQPQTIVGVTSGPVVKVTVVGSGAIFCSGSYGVAHRLRFVGHCPWTDAADTDRPVRLLAAREPGQCHVRCSSNFRNSDGYHCEVRNHTNEPAHRPRV